MEREGRLCQANGRVHSVGGGMLLYSKDGENPGGSKQRWRCTALWAEAVTILENEVWKWGRKEDRKLLCYLRNISGVPTFWWWRDMGRVEKYWERKVNIIWWWIGMWWLRREGARRVRVKSDFQSRWDFSEKKMDQDGPASLRAQQRGEIWQICFVLLILGDL